MAEFEYRARDAQGRVLQGRIEAASATVAADKLAAAGSIPLEISEARRVRERKPLWEGRVPVEELAMFSRQMYTLIRAGVPIIRAMGELAANSRSPRLKRVLKSVAENLESGRGLADSMRQHPDVFSTLFVSIVQVGEDSGRLEEGFLQIARHLELDKEMRDRVKAALRYPVMVVVAIAVALAVINLKVIPAFAGVFAKFGAELPLPTRILLAVSQFSVDYWHLIVLAMAVAAAAAVAWVRTPAGRLRWDRSKLRIPKIGDVVLRATLARFARSFAMALRSGVPLIQSLTVVSMAVDNAWVGQKLRDMRTGVEHGEALTRVAQSAGLLTPLVMQMLAVGEETGKVDDMMQEVAEYYEREVEYDLKRLSSYIEPVLIVVMGVMVLVLALGVFLPMWDLGAAARR